MLHMFDAPVLKTSQHNKCKQRCISNLSFIDMTIIHISAQYEPIETDPGVSDLLPRPFGSCESRNYNNR